MDTDDLIIAGGRVMDPETIYDDIANVGIKDGEIVYERNKTMRPDEKHLWYSVPKVTVSSSL